MLEEARQRPEVEAITEDMKNLTRRLYDDVLVGGNLDLIDDLVHDEFVEHEEFPGMPPGKESFRFFVTTIREALPDLTATIEDIIVEDTKAVSRFRFSGTHRGEFVGIPPTGRKIDVQAIDIVAYRDGQIIEHWGVTDQMAMMQQLGVIEEPA